MHTRSRTSVALRFQAERPSVWADSAECREMDPHLFDLDLNPEGHPDAIAACERCPVAAQCRAWAQQRGEVAMVWGGILRPNLDKMPKPADLEQIRSLFEAGWSNNKIANTLGLYRTSVIARIRRSDCLEEVK